MITYSVCVNTQKKHCRRYEQLWMSFSDQCYICKGINKNLKSQESTKALSTDS